jgi:hypothetical protein
VSTQWRRVLEDYDRNIGSLKNRLQPDTLLAQEVLLRRRKLVKTVAQSRLAPAPAALAEMELLRLIFPRVEEQRRPSLFQPRIILARHPKRDYVVAIPPGFRRDLLDLKTEPNKKVLRGTVLALHIGHDDRKP